MSHAAPHVDDRAIDVPEPEEEEDHGLEINRRSLLGLAAFLVLAIAALYLLLPQLAGLEDTWRRNEDGSPWWTFVAFLFACGMFGGYVAMRHLTDFPGSAARYVASCTDASEEPAAEEDWYAGLSPEVAASVQAAEELEEQATTPDELRRAWLGQLPVFADDPSVLEPMLADVVFRPGAIGHEIGELEALGALAATDVPVLAVAGAEDRATPPEAARRIADTAPRGELLLLDGLGHFPFAEAPERYWPALEEWLLSTRG